MEDKKEAYLKCNYYQGMFSNEYFVDFNGSRYPNSDLGGVFVVKENVIAKDKPAGLVKIVVVRKDEKTSQILIPSITESGTFFKVQNEDIVFDKN
jgi:hypothetical protein